MIQRHALNQYQTSDACISILANQLLLYLPIQRNTEIVW